MSVIRPKLPEDPLRYDPSAALATGAVSRAAVAGLADRLEAVRREVLGDADRAAAAGSAASDVAFLTLPDRLLADYGTTRPQSELFAILREARRVREAVDRVVVIGDAAIEGPRAIVEACCHPFHNELARGERGGRPRLSFAAGDLDNDVAQGLLDLVAPHGRPRGDDLLDRWALVIVEEDGGAETAGSVFLAALRDAVGGDERLLADRVVSIRGGSGLVAEPVARAGRPAAFVIPAGVLEGFAVCTAVGLLPASIAGCDVVRLLEGAAAMNRRFREAPVAENPVLQFAAVSRVAAAGAGIAARGLASQTRQLDAVGSWHDRLRAATVGMVGAGGGSAVLTSVAVGECRRDRLVPPSPGPDAASHQRAAGPAAEILLPRLDEHAFGQLLQMLMLATAIEDRLGGS